MSLAGAIMSEALRQRDAVREYGPNAPLYITREQFDSLLERRMIDADGYWLGVLVSPDRVAVLP